MTDLPDKPASPACALDEAPESYRGYLTPQEIAAELAMLAAVLERQGRSALAAQLRAMFPEIPSGGTENAAPDGIAAAFDRLLPRIADDRLHARLRGIRDTL